MVKTEMLDMCQFYTTTGFPTFKPLCKLGKQAGLKCHSKRTDCKQYKESEYTEEKKNGKVH